MQDINLIKLGMVDQILHRCKPRWKS